MAKPTEPVLSATERMLVEKQKMQIKSMRMTQEQLELFRWQHYDTCPEIFKWSTLGKFYNWLLTI